MKLKKRTWFAVAPALILLIILYTWIIVDAQTTEQPKTKSEQSISLAPLADYIPDKPYTYYDVPLTDDLQEYTQDLCRAYGISYPLTLAIMSAESMYQFDLISPTNDYGIMQINKINHADLKAKLNISDFFDPYQNIYAGIYVLAEISEDYESLDDILMVYNCGEKGAKRTWSHGIRSTKFIRDVHSALDELKVVSE